MKDILHDSIWTNVMPVQDLDISKSLHIRLDISKEYGKIISVKILINRHGEAPSIIKNLEFGGVYEMNVHYYTDVQLPMLGNYFYFFQIEYTDWRGKYNKKAIKIDRATGKPILVDENQEAPYWRIFVKPDGLEPPDWAKDTVYYQIFVDRFYRSPSSDNCKQKGRNYRKWGEFPNWHKNEQGQYHNNDFFGGDIRGIREKIGYLKDLGVGVLYLSPINYSSLRYDRYAATDHKKVDPDAGTIEDLDEFHEEVAKNGMHNIQDIALNHCNIDNPLFQEALHNPNSPYRDLFIFDENGNYKYWMNEFKDMPIFNQSSPIYQKLVYGDGGIIDEFLPYVDGFRYDVAEEMLPTALEGITKRANRDRKRICIGESWYEPKDITILGKSYHTTTNYLFTDAVYKYVLEGDCIGFESNIRKVLDSYPQFAIDTMLNSLDTHDTIRAITLTSGKERRRGPFDRAWEIDKDPSRWHSTSPSGERIFATEAFRQFEFDNDPLTEEEYKCAKETFMVCFILISFLPGCPCLYYGTEAGLWGYKDPDNRKTFPWDRMDKELHDLCKEVIRVRKSCKLQKGFPSFPYMDSTILKYTIRNYCNSVFVAVNRTPEKVKIDWPEEFNKSRIFYKRNMENGYFNGKGGIIMIK